jgi:tetratricopeptide (TPR) repeat protein
MIGQAAPRPASRRRVPYTALSLLGIMVIMATVMTSYVLPRLGGGTVTTFFEGDLAQAKALKELQRAADRSPTEENLLALADNYWQINDFDNAEASYMRMTTELSPVPAVAYSRLGYLKLQRDNDIPAAMTYFEQARAANPNDLDTLFTLSEIYFSQARPDDAIQALETYLSLPDGAQDTEVQTRLELFKKVAPVLNAATKDPTEKNLSALAETYWQVEERERAADIYVQILSNFDAHNALAYSRLGQVLFFSGRNDQAIDMLERAKAIDDTDLNTLLFLGNAYFSTEQLEKAIATWEHYVEVAGGEAAAGRVPGLIENAKARLAAGPSTPEAVTQDVSGASLFASNCAACHGAVGQGGVGPTLVANKRAMDAANVRSLIQFGRGMMPGFVASLTEEQISLLTDYVVNSLSQGQTSERP